MELWLDTTDYTVIKNAHSLGILTGVTTNPSILSKAEDCPEKILENLLTIQSGRVAVQVTQSHCDGMVRQAVKLAALSKQIIVKIPACEDGFKAIGLLTQQGIPTLATTIFEPQQIIFSAMLGAKYAAPYLGRLPGDSIATLADMQGVINAKNYAIKMMAAAIRSCEQFVECARLGVAAVTLPVPVYQALFMPSKEVVDSLDQFKSDWLSKAKNQSSALFTD